MILHYLHLLHKSIYDNAEKITGVAFGAASGTTIFDMNQFDLARESEQLGVNVLTAACVALVTGTLGAIGAHFAKKLIKKFGW